MPDKSIAATRKVTGEVRRNVAPPAAMGTAAMNEQKAAFVRPRRLTRPNQVMDRAARYRHELRLAGTGNCPPKPIRRRRTDRQKIGWYRFAAQRGCTRIYCIGPATDRPTSCRSKDPAHSVALRQQCYLAVGGAAGKLEGLPGSLGITSAAATGETTLLRSLAPTRRAILPAASSRRG